MKIKVTYKVFIYLIISLVLFIEKFQETMFIALLIRFKKYIIRCQSFEIFPLAQWFFFQFITTALYFFKY